MVCRRRRCRCRLRPATTVFFGGTWSEMVICTCRARSALKWRERNEFTEWTLSLTARLKYLGHFLRMEAKWTSFTRPHAQLADGQPGDPMWTPHCFLLCSIGLPLIWFDQVRSVDLAIRVCYSIMRLPEGLLDSSLKRWASVLGLESFWLLGPPSFFMERPLGLFFREKPIFLFFNYYFLLIRFSSINHPILIN